MSTEPGAGSPLVERRPGSLPVERCTPSLVSVGRMASMAVRRRMVVLALAGGALPLVLSGSADAARPGRDLAVVSVKADDTTAGTGELVTVKVVAVNQGGGHVDQAVIASDVAGLTVESATCAFGVSPDGPNNCEYGAPPPGRRFTTVFKVRAAAPTKHVHKAAFQVCTTNLSGDADPVPGNNCRSVTIKLVGGH
ncbi:MAG: DUF11 domain-containing protein [Actinobacteria bacterium]|nr:DUF11 domain-containing protein [Actinomycetota bacterium]